MDKAMDWLGKEPALAWKMAVNILGKDETSPAARQSAAEVREAQLVKDLLATCDRQHSAYKKWDGAHWVLSILADLGYPAGDESLRPLMEETFNTWLSKVHETRGLKVIDGLVRRCASQEGYAIWSSLRLGFADKRTEELVSRLLKWQWPDGGWNCSKHREADTSSFMETLIPVARIGAVCQMLGRCKSKGCRRTRRRGVPDAPVVQTPQR